MLRTRSPVSPRGAGAVTPGTDVTVATARWIAPAAVPPDPAPEAGRGCVTPTSAPLTQPAVESPSTAAVLPHGLAGD
jgi:hypothetical protein